MRHEAENPEIFRIDSGDIVDRTVRIGGPAGDAVRIAIAEGDPALSFEALDRLGAGFVIALAMRDCNLDDLAPLIARRKGRIGALNSQMLHPAYEAQTGIAHQDTGQKARLNQDLKAVADAKNEAAPGGMGANRLHDWRARGDRPAAQIVAIGEAPGEEHNVGARGQGVFRMPDEGRLHAGHTLKGADGIALAIGTGEENDGGAHSMGVQPENFRSLG